MFKDTAYDYLYLNSINDNFGNLMVSLHSMCVCVCLSKKFIINLSACFFLDSPNAINPQSLYLANEFIILLSSIPFIYA